MGPRHFLTVGIRLTKGLKWAEAVLNSGYVSHQGAAVGLRLLFAVGMCLTKALRCLGRRGGGGGAGAHTCQCIGGEKDMYSYVHLTEVDTSEPSLFCARVKGGRGRVG